MSQDNQFSQKMRLGAIWIYIQSGLGAVLTFATGIVMARLLNPDDFGTFYTVTAFTTLLALQIRFGLPSALLQSKELDESQWNRMFWAMEAAALFCLGLTWAAADWMESFYAAPGYAEVMRWMSMIFLIIPFTATNETHLRRQMKFDAIAKVYLGATVLGSAVGIAAAYYGLGALSLAIGGLTSAIYAAGMMYWKSDWRPGWDFSLRKLGPLFSFAWRMHMVQSLIMATEKVDSMLIGKLSGVYTLGLYQRANSTARLPVDQLSVPMFQLFFGGFSRIQDDIKTSLALFEKALYAMSSAVFLVLIGLYFVAEPFIYLLYGDKWVEAVDPLRILILTGFPMAFNQVASALGAAQKLIGREIYVWSITLVLTAVAIIVGNQWGLMGIATGLAIKSYITFLLMHRMLQTSHLQVGWDVIVRGLGPVTLVTIGTAAVGFLVEWLAQDILLLEARTLLYLLVVGTAITLTYAVLWLLASNAIKNDNQAAEASLSMVSRTFNKVLRRT